MAQWSEAAIRERVEKQNAVILDERSELFKVFRACGWGVSVISPISLVPQKDTWFHPGVGCHFLVKMPGAHPMRIKTLDQLRRLAKGVS